MSISKKACRAYSGQMLAISPDSGLLSASQIDWLVTTQVKILDHHRVLILHFYSREQAAQGIFTPHWTIFQGAKEFVTAEYKEDGKISWRTAGFTRLTGQWNFADRCAFACLSDQQRVGRFFRDSQRTGFASLIARQYDIQAKRRRDQEKKTRQRIQARMRTVPPTPRGLKPWVLDKVLPAYFLYHRADRHREADGVCTACCKEIHLTGVKYNEEGVCPLCGHKLTMKTRTRMGNLQDRETCQIVQRTAPNEVVIRVFKVICNHARWELELWEAGRQFLRLEADGTLALEDYYSSFGVWRRGARPVYSSYQYNYPADLCGHVYCRGMAQALRGTPWQYCPTQLFYDHFREPMEMAPFLQGYLKHPRLEHLIKVGFYNLASDLVYRSVAPVLDEGRNRTHQILRVASEDIPFLRESGVNLRQLSDYQTYCTRTLKDRQRLFSWQREHRITDIDRMILPCLDHATPHRFMGYIDAQASRLIGADPASRRYTKVSDVVQEYSDYLNLCRQLKYDLKNKFILFPKDLQKAHDQAAQQCRKKESARMRRAFCAAMKQIKSHLDFELDGMVIRCPESPKELIREGQVLHHCVGSYVDRVAQKQCIIVFLRRKEAADQPFYTLEVRNGKVVQARTTGNSPATPEVQRFIDLWERRVLQATA